MDIEKYTRLKKKVDRLQSEADKAEGACAELLKRLKKEFGCNTLEEGKKLLKQLLRKKEEGEEKFNEQYQKFLSKWKDSLPAEDS